MGTAPPSPDDVTVGRMLEDEMKTARDMGAEAQIYRILSRVYGSPSDGLPPDGLSAALRTAANGLEPGSASEALEELEVYLAGPVDAMELAREYVRLFRGPVRALVYPYESMYVDGEVMGPSTLDAVERYREAGLGVSEGFRDLPDHISTELEFMYYLASMEQRCLDEGDDAGSQHFSGLRRSFLQDHLARWVPGFADRVIGNTTSPFYRGLAAITWEFVSRQVPPIHE